MHATTFFDGDGWRDGVLAVDSEGRMLLRAETPAAEMPRLDGVVVGGFTDHHVHLQLVDAGLLDRSRLGRVVDLGGNPAALNALSAHRAAPPQPPARQHSGPTIEFAGAFLTPPGGYPSDRDWAPAGSFREIADDTDASAAVAEMADAGASCIKVADNSTAGPVFDDALLRAIVEAAEGHGLSVVAHAEGQGEAQRVARSGAGALAHTPFTERLSDDEIAEQAASVSWISTLAIHEDAEARTAIDNARRFHEAGGTLLYGTDMGNGPTPVDLHPGEVASLRAAGVDGVALLRALAPCDPVDPDSPLLLLPGTDADPLHARRLTPADLKV